MPRTITFLVASAFELLDLSGAMSAFNIARNVYAAPYDLAVASGAGGDVSTCTGPPVGTVALDPARHHDTIITVGGADAHLPAPCSAIVDLLRLVAPTTQRLASVCTGAFYLAEAGILDGRRATTHWRWAPTLRARFPKVSVEADRIYTADRGVWTSAGITAGIDMALAMIEADFGSELSKSVAREMVVYHRRPGGQSQFSTILELEPASDRIREAPGFARDHLGDDLSVDRLADVACISSRQFSRIFLKETGETPARAIERLRAEVARPKVADFIIVGHSMGGKVAQLVAAAQPDGLEGLILIAPAPSTPLDVPEEARQGYVALYQTREGAGTVIGKLTPHSLSNLHREQIIEDTLRGSPGAKRAWPEQGMIEDISDSTARITVPVHIIPGEDDGVEPETSLRNAFGKVKGVQFTVLPEVGHIAPLEAPATLADAIRAVPFA